MEKNPVKLSKIDLEKEEDKIFIEVILNNSNYPVNHIIERYQTSIYKMIRYKKFTKLNMEEIFFEGLSRVIFNIHTNKFRKDSSVVTFLIRTCYFVCLDEIYKKRTVRLEQDTEMEMEEESEDFQKLKNIEKLKKKIDEKCREIIDLRFYSKQNTCLSFDEIAKSLNINVDNARKRLYRCIDNLKKLIDLDPELRDYTNKS